MSNSCYILVTLLACAALAIEDDQPYCAVRYRRLCQGKGRHVACQFPAPGPGLNCQNYTQIKFTSELRHFITHYINRRRQRIAAGHERVRGGAHLPRPQIMMFVEWDRELASLAQRLADQCYFVHDDCRATVRYPYAGQTVGEVRWRRSSDSDELSAQRAIRRVFDAWWGERRRVEPRQLTQPFRITAKGSVWGHFSQIAVWTLRAVGCGAVRHGADHPRLLLVCDFSHTNMLGQRTISPGKPAPCPDHTKRKPRSGYPLLCAAVRHPSAYVDTEEPRDDVYQYEDEEEDVAPETDKETTKKDYEAVPYVQPLERAESRTVQPGAKSSRRKLFEDRIPVDYDGAGSKPYSPTPSHFEEKITTRELEAKSKRRKLFEQRQRLRPSGSSEESLEETSQITTRPSSPANDEIIDVPEFQPVSEASFYNKLAVQLGSAKAEEGARRPTPRPREPEEEEYSAVPEQKRREDDRHKLRMESRKRLPMEATRFRGKTQEPETEKDAFNIWQTRKPVSENWREVTEEIYQPPPKRRPQVTTTVATRPSRRTTTTELAETSSDLQNMRHRWNWKQTRDRPRRPGAAALLHTSTAEPPSKETTEGLRTIPGTGQSAFVTDEEVVDQLFKDTGFNPSWRKSSP